MAILVTGGAGYIGSHTCIELLNAGHDVVIYDSLVNSKIQVLDRIVTIAGKAPIFVHGDILDEVALSEVFARYSIDAVIHFAGLKAVGESSEIPLHYYQNNVSGSVVLFKTMAQHNCYRIVFSSSATVYGDKAPIPYVETLPVQACNVYGRTKLMVEDILKDCVASPGSLWQVSLLRYFNPIGAHDSGLIGEDPEGVPNNLLPYVAQVAVGKRDELTVFGNDYPTHDGTGIRDYIHVVDLALGHVNALSALTQPGVSVYNLGSGRGYSVLEIVSAFEKASGKPVAYRFAERRAGDLAEYYANADLARDKLGWVAKRDLQTMVEDTWRWQSENPEGYEG